MRIVILFRTIEGPWGGGNQFLKSLKKVWITKGIEVLDGLEADVDGVLINAHMLGAHQLLPPRRIAQLVKTGYLSWLAPRLGRHLWKGSRPPFVHRLDGIVRLYGRNDPYMDWAQKEINRRMDWTIYQSDFCRQSFAVEGVDVSRSTVILNGVDLERFFPTTELPPLAPFRLMMVSWSPNVNKGMPYAAQASQLPGVEVTFIGQWPPGLPTANVRLMPPQPNDTLPDLLRQHHALLHMASNDPCSNAILEAMACGLPVIYHPSGGSPEIVGGCGVACAENLQAAIDELRERYLEIREMILARRQELSIERAAGHYLSVFVQLGRFPAT